jgi:hypothetical protein
LGSRLRGLISGKGRKEEGVSPPLHEATSLAQHDDKTRRKEVKIMKIRNLILAGLLLIGSVGATATAMADDGVLLKEEVAPDSYCHQKFRAMDPNTLGSDQPVLKSADNGDVIDYYGPCDESATGKNQVWNQKLDWLFLQDAQ